ncbi:MAG: hypothetical protein PQJ50_08145 [Spirochaetales bacterium]|nr:hypothetical protein [Spirochaetales bacterium]
MPVNRTVLLLLLIIIGGAVSAQTIQDKAWQDTAGQDKTAQMRFRDEVHVSIYDDFDDGSFGRSEYRSVLRSVKLSAFGRTKTHPVASPAWELTSHLTAVVLTAEREEEIRSGVYDSVISSDGEIYTYSSGGLEFSFSLEKPGAEIRALLESYYKDEYTSWLEPVWEHYSSSYIIRIHSAENIFEPWREFIQYREALLMATILGDRDQWLWGIHDGLDILHHSF